VGQLRHDAIARLGLAFVGSDIVGGIVGGIDLPDERVGPEAIRAKIAGTTRDWRGEAADLGKTIASGVEDKVAAAFAGAWSAALRSITLPVDEEDA
jgi:hypothetical protein